MQSQKNYEVDHRQWSASKKYPMDHHCCSRGCKGIQDFPESQPKHVHQYRWQNQEVTSGGDHHSHEFREYIAQFHCGHRWEEHASHSTGILATLMNPETKILTLNA